MPSFRCFRCGYRTDRERRSCPHCGSELRFTVGDGLADFFTSNGGILFVTLAIVSLFWFAYKQESRRQIDASDRTPATALQRAPKSSETNSSSRSVKDRARPRLSPSRKQEIYRALSIEQDLSYCRAEEKHPYDRVALANAVDSAGRHDIRQVAARYGISVSKVREIMVEGTKKMWPIPPSPCG